VCVCVFVCVCVCDVTIAPRLRRQQQIKFAEGTALTRFTTRVITIWEYRRVSSFQSYGKLFYFRITSVKRNFLLHAMCACTEWYSTYL